MSEVLLYGSETKSLAPETKSLALDSDFVDFVDFNLIDRMSVSAHAILKQVPEQPYSHTLMSRRRAVFRPLHPAPCTLHPAFYSLHSAPYTPHPKTCTLNLTPYTPNT